MENALMIRAASVFAAASLAFCLAAKADPVVPPAITIDITAIVEPVAPGEGVGYAAVGFDGINYWAARWASSRVTRISTAGAFVDSFDIEGLSGIRAMTWDGTHFWMANNTTTLWRVDPVTLSVLSTITLPVQSRYASFDPTADGGQGGFWIGNFSGDILLVSMQGVTLSTLPEANIGFSGRYGLALDRSGPSARLWTYFQGGTNNVEIGSISLPDGTSNPVTIDLFPYLAPSTSALAGGAFVTNLLPGGRQTLLTLCQCTPNNILLGIELEESLIFSDGFEQR